MNDFAIDYFRDQGPMEQNLILYMLLETRVNNMA